MSETHDPNRLRGELRNAWYRFLDEVAPLRPALHAYCRRLAGSLFDAEDLAQDTLLRAFGHLGFLNHDVRSPRAYLLRTATNVWIDEQRRRERERLHESANGDENAAGADAAGGASGAGEARDAGVRLLQRLSPQERAALVLKEMFEMSLEEIADLLATTPGAVKAALHRGRERLGEPEGGKASRRPLPAPELVDRFVERWTARDLGGLAHLLLDGASVENVGEALQYGRETFERTQRNILWHVVHGHAEWPAALQPEATRMERADFEGEPIVLAFATYRGKERLQAVFRFEEQEGLIARIRIYGFCPETIRAIGEAFGLPVATGLYRPPVALAGQRT